MVGRRGRSAVIAVACALVAGCGSADKQGDAGEVGRSEVVLGDPQVPVTAAPRRAAALPAMPPPDLRRADRLAGLAEGSGGCAAAAAEPASGNLETTAAAILCLHNSARTGRGLGRLRVNARLTRAAHLHSRDMVARSYFSHESPSGRTFVDRLRAQGYRGRSIGENIAFGTGSLAAPRAILDSWLGSAGHRANILRRGFREIGVGVALGTPGRRGSGGAVYTVTFGG